MQIQSSYVSWQTHENFYIIEATLIFFYKQPPYKQLALEASKR